MTFASRFLREAGVILAAATLVAVLAFAAAREIVLAMGRVRMDEYGTRLMGEAGSLAGETARVLARANGTGHPFCSDAELVLLRDLAFNSHFAKDVGRMQGDFLHCSGSLGRLDAPVRREVPDVIGAAGERIYANANIVMVGGERGLVVEHEGANVVLRPDSLSGLAQPPFEYMMAIVSPERRQVVRTWGRRFPLAPDHVLIAGAWRSGDMEFASRCSPAWSLCTVTGFSRADMIADSLPLLAAFVVAGGAGGGLAGLSGVLFWRRSQSMTARLKRALDRDALDVVYQPIVSLADGRVTGAEALVRWNDGGTNVRPDVFVQVAEEHGFVDRITAFVVRRVLAEMGALLRERSDLRITINAAATDLADAAFGAVLEQATGAAGVARARIGIELTERSSADPKVVQATAHLRESGHTVYIDDFGTGYSSLSYLHRLSVDVIKIDRAFTLTVGTEAVTASVLPQIIDMARTLKLGVVVEGIETKEQADYFRKAGWPVSGQGWLFSRPLPAGPFIALVTGEAGAPESPRRDHR
jgi:sensor c-di-GMP phosphodiesterase-like protein